MLIRHITGTKIGDAAPTPHPDLRSVDRGRAVLWGVAGAIGMLSFCFNALGPLGIRFIWGWALGIPAFRIVPLADLLLSAFAFAMAARALGLSRRAATLAPTIAVGHRGYAALAIAAGVLLSLLAVWLLRGFPNSGDSYDYLYEARTFLAGRLWNPLPPVPAAFASSYIIHRTIWAAAYPPGWPLLLAAGLLLRLPAWLIDPLIGGVLLLAVLKLAERRDGRLGGALAVVLVALSPFFVFNAGSYFTHVSAATAGLLFCLAATEYLDNPHVSTAVLVGLALGALGLIRPEDVLIFGVPFAVEFFRRARWSHYRQLPAIGLSGLPFLGLLLAFYFMVTGSPLPAMRQNQNVHLGFAPVDVHGHHLTVLHQLWIVLVRFVGLAEWTSPILVLGFAAAFYALASRRRLTFVDFVFPVCIIFYMMIPYSGDNQYGPRYYFDAFPCLVLTFVSGVVPLLKDAARQQRAGFAWFVLLAHAGFSLVGVAIIGSWMRTMVDQRMDLYAQVRKQDLHHAVVVVRSGTSPIAPMLPLDLTRNGIDPRHRDVLYVLDLPHRLPALERAFPGRRFYVYERAKDAPTGALHPLSPPLEPARAAAP